MKDVKGKPILSYVPFKALEKIAKVREFGINKYSDDASWKNVNRIDFIDATLRHLHKHMDAIRYNEGSVIDDESGLPHLDHAATSLILALSLTKSEIESSEEEVTDEWSTIL